MAEYPASELELSLAELRENYIEVLDEASVAEDPIGSLNVVSGEAQQAGLPEPSE